VAQPSVITTLFPHLGSHKVHEFRWALIAGLVGVVLLYVTGLIAAAILLSAFLVPVLYLIYLYEAQVYRDEPALVLGFTIGGGVVIGVVVTLAERFIFNPFQYNPNPLSSAGVSIGLLLGAGLVVPVVQEVLKAVPAIFLPNRSDFPETVDGLVFGVAAGLGFSFAETLIGFASVLPTLGRVAPGNWIFSLATLAVFEPLLQGTATGLVVAAIWRYRRGRLAAREIGGIALALIAHVAFAFGSLTLKEAAVNAFAVLVWQALVVGALLIYMRYLLHHALMEEAAHMGFSETVCPNCHMHIVASGFCPNCGVALTAAPNALKRNRRPRKDPASVSGGGS
jgi:hypothetical protein